MDSLYFAYGSNLSLSQMRDRCTSARPIRTRDLPGYKLVLRGAADVELCAGEVVNGALYWVSEDDQRALDGYESVPNLYVRRTFEVEEGTAIFYQMDPPQYKAPRQGYVETIRQGFVDWNIPHGSLDRAVKEQDSINT